MYLVRIPHRHCILCRAGKISVFLRASSKDYSSIFDSPPHARFVFGISAFVLLVLTKQHQERRTLHCCRHTLRNLLARSQLGVDHKLSISCCSITSEEKLLHNFSSINLAILASTITRKGNLQYFKLKSSRTSFRHLALHARAPIPHRD